MGWLVVLSEEVDDPEKLAAVIKERWAEILAFVNGPRPDLMMSIQIDNDVSLALRSSSWDEPVVESAEEAPPGAAFVALFLEAESDVDEEDLLIEPPLGVTVSLLTRMRIGDLYVTGEPPDEVVIARMAGGGLAVIAEC